MEQFENTAIGKIDICGTLKDIVSNTVTANLFDERSVTIEKKQSCDFIIEGQNLTYTIEITNNTRIPLNNFEIIDDIPLGMDYVENSFMVNGVSESPTVSGQNLKYFFEQLPVGTTEVKFDVVLNQSVVM